MTVEFRMPTFYPKIAFLDAESSCYLLNLEENKFKKKKQAILYLLISSERKIVKIR